MAATTARGVFRGYEVHTGELRSTITTNETNQLWTGPGKVGHVTVWNVGTTATIDIYDHASGTTNKIFEWVSADGKGTFAIQCPVVNGIRVVTGGTFGGCNIVWSGGQ
jgi:hypothetical protein